MRNRAAALLAGAVTGLWGLGWGLPGPGRLRAFPEGLTMTPDVARSFADAWTRLYAQIQASHVEMRSEEPVTYVKGFEEYPPGWSAPPDKLINSFRALLLQSYNPDEKKSFIILGQMRPWKLDFKPLYIYYGGAFIYPLGIFLKVLSWVGALSIGDLAHYLQRPQDLGRAYYLGRLFILLFHLGTVWILFDLGNRLGNEPTGLAAAVLFCLCPVVAVNSHLLKPHPYAAFWCLAAVRFALAALESGRPRDYLLCGTCCGMAAGAAFSFACFTWLPLLPWALRRREGSSAAGEFRPAAAAAALGVLLFLVTNPYFVFSYRDYAWDIKIHKPAEGVSSWRSLLSILKSASGAIGPGLSLAFLIGLAAAWRKDKASRFLALTFLALFGALWVLFGRFYSFGLSGTGIRYYYPLFGLACVLAADGLARFPFGRLGRGLALGAVLLDAAPRGLVYLENMRLDSTPSATRSRAADWIEAHVPPGASIGLTRYPEPAHTPPFRYDRYRLAIFETTAMIPKGREPEYLVVDREGVESLSGWEAGKYEEIAAFDPVPFAWARAADTSFFANVPIRVFRRSKPPAS